MTIQINTDNNIHGTEALTAQYEAQIESELSRFSDQITRIDQHFCHYLVCNPAFSSLPVLTAPGNR